MTENVEDFLHSLLLFVAAATSIEYAGTPRGLWRNKAVATDAAATYTVAQIYPGPPLVLAPINRISVQWRTTGKDSPAMLQAQRIFDALRAADGTPMRMRAITGKTTAGSADGVWRLVSVEHNQRPGFLGRDDKGIADYVFNSTLGFFKEPI